MRRSHRHLCIGTRRARLRWAMSSHQGTHLQLARRNKIALLNDNFRATFLGGKTVMTAGVNALPIDVKAAAFLKVKTFADFTDGNDPYGEHDFGSFVIGNERFFWKIDYYDHDLTCGSEDPGDPD